MSYYSEKRKVMIEIRQLAEKGNSLEDIQFYILEKYAFSENFVTKYYTKLEERGFIKPKKK